MRGKMLIKRERKRVGDRESKRKKERKI